MIAALRLLKLKSQRWSKIAKWKLQFTNWGEKMLEYSFVLKLKFRKYIAIRRSHSSFAISLSPRISFTIKSTHILVQSLFMLCEWKSDNKEFQNCFMTVTNRLTAKNRMTFRCRAAYLSSSSKWDFVSSQTHSTNLCLTQKHACYTLRNCSCRRSELTMEKQFSITMSSMKVGKILQRHNLIEIQLP